MYPSVNRTKNHSLEAALPLNGVNPTSKLLKFNQSATETKMDKVNGIDMQLIYKKRGNPRIPTDSGRREKRLLKPEKTRIVGKGSDHERLQEYRPRNMHENG